MDLDDSSDVLFINFQNQRCNLAVKQACGDCDVCRKKASSVVITQVLEARYGQRGRSYENSGPEERRYVRSRMLFLLSALGLTEEELDEETLRRMEWGRMMRRLQLEGGDKRPLSTDYNRE